MLVGFLKIQKYPQKSNL